MKLPTPPHKGSKSIPYTFFQDVVNCFRSQKIQQSGDIYPMEGAGGTQLYLLGRNTTASNFLRFGLSITALTSGATIGLQPCNVSGTTSATNTLSVYLKSDKSTYAVSNGASVDTHTIIPYVTSSSGGEMYVLGTPKIMLADSTYLTTGTHGFYVKTMDDWGMFHSTASTWTLRFATTAITVAEITAPAVAGCFTVASNGIYVIEG